MYYIEASYTYSLFIKNKLDIQSIDSNINDGGLNLSLLNNEIDTVKDMVKELKCELKKGILPNVEKNISETIKKIFLMGKTINLNIRDN